jgi:hypothetical protein
MPNVTIKLAIAAGCLLAMVRPGLAQQAEITGTWDLTITTAQGPRSAELILKEDAGKIVGTVTRSQGDVPVQATVKEKAVTMNLTVPTENGPLNVVMTGTVEGNTGGPASSMSGAVDLGAMGQGQWVAKRTGTPSAAMASSPNQSTTVDVTGAWAFAVEFSGGSGAPTMTFKQEGEKLTGQYVGQLGEAPLSGTIKGNAIDFTIKVTVEGTVATIQYTGTVEGASMKGTVKLGDLGEGTFTATKKKP